MKQLIVILALTLPLSALADSLILEGQTVSGKACSLAVENPEAINSAGAWEELELLVRSPWQAPDSEALLTWLSPTPYTLYGRSETGPDRIALMFRASPVPDLRNLHSYSFQTRDERGLVQEFCRKLKPQGPLN